MSKNKNEKSFAELLFVVEEPLYGGKHICSSSELAAALKGFEYNTLILLIRRILIELQDKSYATAVLRDDLKKFLG